MLTYKVDRLSRSLLDFARHSCGVALLPDWQVRDELAAGRLARLLPDYRFPRQGVYAVYPDTRHLPEKVRAFIDFFADYLAARRGEEDASP